MTDPNIGPREATRKLEGAIVIVTGASRGLGQHCALEYARQGAKVAVVGRTGRETGLRLPGNVFLTARMMEEKTGAAVLPLVCDIADPMEVDAMVQQVLRRWGRIDVLLNNAASVLAEGERATEISLLQFEQMFRVNVLGTFQVIRSVLPAMVRQRSGSIINVSGRSVKRGSPLEATKAAIEALTVGLADALRGEHIAVNSLRPVGFIDTPGVLMNTDVRGKITTPPDSYVAAAVYLAMQTADTYSGQLKTDAEVLSDLAGAAAFDSHAASNLPGWRDSLAKPPAW